MAVISVRCLGRGAEPLLSFKEALASFLGRTPDQIRRTLARAESIPLRTRSCSLVMFSGGGERSVSTVFVENLTISQLSNAEGSLPCHR
jgi:hypothetical protein